MSGWVKEQQERQKEYGELIDRVVTKAGKVWDIIEKAEEEHKVAVMANSEGTHVVVTDEYGTEWWIDREGNDCS